MPLDLNALGGHEFEDLVEKLLIAMGFKTEGRKPAADGGIDIVAVSSQPFVSGRYVIQCKRYTGSVSAPIIRDLYGVVNATNANKGILITTSHFTSEGIEFAKDKPIELIDGTKLVNLLQQYSLLTEGSKSQEDLDLLKMDYLRDELAGFADVFESTLQSLDKELNLAGRQSFGDGQDIRTYKSYEAFKNEVFQDRMRYQEAAKAFVVQLTDVLHSPTVEIESFKELEAKFRELSQFLIEVYRKVKRANPPPEFSASHEILRSLTRELADGYLSFLRQLEDIIKAGGKGNVKFNASTSRMTEYNAAWNSDLEKVKRKLRLS